jgi:hypothetical protein
MVRMAHPADYFFPLTGAYTFSDKILRHLPVFNSLSATQSRYPFIPECPQCPPNSNYRLPLGTLVSGNNVSGTFNEGMSPLWKTSKAIELKQ